MKAGNILWPISRTNTKTGQLVLPIFGEHPVLLIERKPYESDSPYDCQSEGIEDWRWIVLQAGEILWMTETALEGLFEYR